MDQEVTLATCHPNRKMQARGLCKPCYDKWLKSVNPQYKENQIKNTTKWSKLNPEKRRIATIKRQERALQDPLNSIKKRNRMLKRKYGITQEDYDRILTEQNGSCAICLRKPALGKYLHVDHSHESGIVRGLLCHQCNWYLGSIDADPEIINRIISYRKKG